jgi:hypothetical protein
MLNKIAEKTFFSAIHLKLAKKKSKKLSNFFQQQNLDPVPDCTKHRLL